MPPIPAPPSPTTPTRRRRRPSVVAAAAVAAAGALVVSAAPARAAGNADVDFVSASQSAAGTWTFSVTVSHPDTGWDDYADGWDVVDEATGAVLKRPGSGDPFTRLLLHPHVDEQPFERSQSGLVVESAALRVRAHDLKDGWGGIEVALDLCQVEGDRYEVTRAQGENAVAFAPPCEADGAPALSTADEGAYSNAPTTEPGEAAATTNLSPLSPTVAPVTTPTTDNEGDGDGSGTPSSSPTSSGGSPSVAGPTSPHRRIAATAAVSAAVACLLGG